MMDINQNPDQADHNAQQLIRRTKQLTRHRFTPEEKVRILYYKWLKDFMEAGQGRLKGDTLREVNRAEVETLKQENQRLKELVAQLSLENLVLKKSLG